MATDSNDYLFSLAPGYVNGVLSDSEKAAVEAALPSNKALADEIAAFRQIAAAVKQTPMPEDAGTEFGWHRLQRDMRKDRLAAATRSGSPLWRYAAAILGVVALGQAVMMTATTGAGDKAEYAVASGPAASAHILKVEFAADASISALSGLLKAVDGDIVSGPSTRNLYDVRFPSEAALEKALVELAEREDIVALAARG